MNSLPAVITPKIRLRRILLSIRSLRYLWVAIIAYSLVVLIVLAYLNRPPIYASAMSVVLPGSGSSSSFNIEEVGQANQSTKTPFGSMAFSPLVNYKEIIRGRAVIHKAAEKLGVSKAVLTVPRVELRERSSILHIYLDGAAPDKAQAYGWAVYEAFQEVLTDLRADEINKRDASVDDVLSQYRRNLEKTRQAIVAFQQRSLLVSTGQIDELTALISVLDEKSLTLTSRAGHTEDFVRQLSVDLGSSPFIAGKALRLQSDVEFRSYLTELNSSAAKVAEYSSRWGENHQKVIAQTLRFEEAKTSLQKRSKMIVGENAADVLYAMDLQTSPRRAELLADLIKQYAKLQGVNAELRQVKQQLLQMNDRLRIYMREAAELERLEREHALAEAVYTSAAAKLEAGKADIFASYPPVQLLAVPGLPDKPKSPNTKIAMAMGFLGIVFITFGLLTLWHRQYFINLLLKNG